MNPCTTMRHRCFSILILTLAAATLSAGLTACGGGGDNPAPSSSASPPPVSPPAPGGGVPDPRSITASLSTGSYLEFLATSNSTSVSPAGSSATQDYGQFRLTLGAPRQVAGISGFSVAVSGKTTVGGHAFGPRWTFIAQVGTGWLGSVDDQTLVTLYEPAMPAGATGFFLAASASRPLSAAAGRFEGAYNSYQGLSVGAASSDGGCRWVLSDVICGATTTTFSQQELLVDGIGPVGFRQSVGYISSGSAPQTIRRTLTLELVGTSLAARDGTAVKPPPWRAGPALAAARFDARAVPFGSSIYLFGGTGADASYDARRVDRFDLASRSWLRLPDAPHSLAGWLPTVVGTRIALFGGTDGLLFEPGSGRWTATARLLAPGTITGLGSRTRTDGRAEVIAIVDRGLAYLQATLVRYLPDTNAWQTLGLFDRGQRANYEAVMLGDRFVLIGGFANGSYLATLSSVDIATLTVRQIGRLADAVVQPAVTLLGSRIVVAGGYNFGGERRSVQFVDTVSGAVVAGPDLLGGVQGAAAAVHQGTLVLFGGKQGDDRSSATDAVWIFSD